MRPATISGCVRIPVEHVNLKQVLKQLTYRYTPMGAEAAIEVQAYRLDGDFVCTPRQYGLKLCNQLQIPVEDETTMGAEVTFPKIPTPRDYQVETLDQVEEKFGNYYDVLFRAHTGWGKTIGSLITASRFGRAILVIVDQENLKTQWTKVLTDPNLFGFKASDIGQVQGDKCDYKGKAVTIAMVQTLTQREYGPEFYGHFGFMIGDEVHTLGAPTFSQVLFDFPAAWRLFVSATPKRKDGLQKAIDHHCGPLRVAADKEHDESSVYILRNDRVYSWYGNISPKTGRIISEVSEDAQRNLMLAEAAMWLGESGRDTLILSDRVEHLKELKYLLVYLGVEEEEIGLYTGYDPVWVFTKDPKPATQPRGLHRWENEEGERKFAEYSAVSFQLKQKKTPKARLTQIEKTCRYILATYGKFAKGVDVPRLAGGIDATPRSTSEQAQGRILRKEDGKLKPIWFTIVDENNYRLLHSFTGRIGDYLNSNSRLYEWDGQEGIEEWNEAELYAEVRARYDQLKAMEIVPDGAGRHRLQKAGTAKRQEGQAMKARLRRRSREAT